MNVRGVGSAVRRVRESPSRLFRRIAGWLADRERLPTSARAVFGYYSAEGVLDLDALRLQPRVEDRLEAMVEDAFADVEAAIAEEFDRAPEAVEFDYETKLLMPAELALAHFYREIYREAEDGFDPVAREVRPGLWGKLPWVAGQPVEPEFSDLIRRVDRVERATRLAVVALLDGDMRDAINDDEYEDFETNVADTATERQRVAEIAQSTLEAAVQKRFDQFPDSVREAYDRAVEHSEAHQDRDERFRSLLEAARSDESGARREIRQEYKHADFGNDQPPEAFSSRDLDLPYFRTQYGRVGVIYTGMIEMYRETGTPVDDAFERSVVLAIIGAQIWLDDVDDFEADMREGQLTPVTAEYLLTDDESAAYERVVSISNRYFDRAREYAADSESTLTGIAVEYILRSGDPDALPGSDR